MKCHHCKATLINSSIDNVWLRCPNDNNLDDVHYTAIKKNRFPLIYHIIITYNNCQYLMYALDIDNITVIEVLDHTRIILKTNTLFDIQIINDIPQFLPLLQKLLALKAFS